MSGLRAIGTTVVLTSLAWVAGIAGWQFSHQGPAPAVPQNVVSASPRLPAAAPQPLARLVGEPLAGSLVVPVAGVPRSALQDNFAQARAAGARLHEALDIPAPNGTPVLAAAPGKVEKLFLSRDGGNTIYVRSDDGTMLYYYAHLSAYANGLAEGRRVRAGEVIAAVGATGDASPEAPHLHFAMMATTPAAKWYEAKQAINPYPLLAAGSQ